MAVLEAPMANFGLIGLVVILLALLAYSAKAARDADDYMEAAEETAGAASRTVGGVLGAITILVYALLGTLYQMGVSSAELADLAAGLFVQAPEFFAGLGVTLLAALGLEGVVPIGALGLVLAAGVLFTLAVVARRRGNPASGGLFG